MRASVIRVLVVAATATAATASVALAQPELLREPWRPASTGEQAAEPEPPRVRDAAAREVNTEVAAPAVEQPAKPAYRAVEVIDPWRRERTKPAPVVRPVATGEGDAAQSEVKVPGSWARVLHEPTPRFAAVPVAVARPTTSWAHPMAEIVNPWRPKRSSWAHVSEVIVDPWSDP